MDLQACKTLEELARTALKQKLAQGRLGAADLPAAPCDMKWMVTVLTRAHALGREEGELAVIQAAELEALDLRSPSIAARIRALSQPASGGGE